TLDDAGAIDHVIREGRHTILSHRPDGTEAVAARAHLVNVFTRFDADPARRRVTSLPDQLGLGSAPSRIATVPQLETLLAEDRRPDFVETGTRVWHYGQTDPNRHVSGMEYLRVMESWVAE